MPSLLQATAAAGVAASNIYYLLTMVAGWRFRLKASPRLPEGAEPATIILPIKGVCEGLEENLRRFCALDYPDYQLVCVLESPADPALPVVERAGRAAPRGRLEAVVGGPRRGLNPKEASHALAYERARHGLIVLADADVSPAPDYLRRVLAPLRDPGVGLVTHPYRFIRPPTPWAELKALTIHAGFLPSVMLAWWLAPVRFGIGATLALRRETLESVGGFPALAGYLASDYRLAQEVAARGLRVVLAPYWLDVRLERCGALDWWRYQCRWTRTMRFTAPAGYAGTLLTQGPFWALCLLASAPGPWTAGAAAFTWAARLASAAWLWSRCFGVERRGRGLWLLPAHDLLAPLSWLAAFAGRRVSWGGREFVLSAGTRIVSYW